MYNGTLTQAQNPERNVKNQKFAIHPKNQMLVIGQKDNLIYQLTDELPNVVIAAYKLTDGINGFYANYAEDGEYKG